MAQVNTTVDPHSLKLSIGLITGFSRSAWSWFLGRLGYVVWTVVLKPGEDSIGTRLVEALKERVPTLVFVDEGIRVRQNSPLWRERGIQVVVSGENWRGKPPKDWWTCETHELSHRALGGVTNGVFRVHMATSTESRFAF
jgi:hypothetical protein